MQLFLTWFYVCSGLVQDQAVVQVLQRIELDDIEVHGGHPLGGVLPQGDVRGPRRGQARLQRLTNVASAFSAACALCEALGPLLGLSSRAHVVWLGIAFFICMHVFIRLRTLRPQPCELHRSTQARGGQLVLGRAAHPEVRRRQAVQAPRPRQHGVQPAWLARGVGRLLGPLGLHVELKSPEQVPLPSGGGRVGGSTSRGLPVPQLAGLL